MREDSGHGRRPRPAIAALLAASRRTGQSPERSSSKMERSKGSWRLVFWGVTAATSLALLLPGPLGPGSAGAGEPPPVDHFQCWLTDFSRSPLTRVRITDEIMSTRVEVRQPQMLCPPVEKTHGKTVTEILNPTTTSRTTRSSPTRWRRHRRPSSRTSSTSSSFRSGDRSGSLCPPRRARMIAPKA